MDTKIVHRGKELIPYLTRHEIEVQVQRVADEISRDYKDENKELFLIGVLNGAFVFMADLIRRIDTNIKFHMDFIKIQTYEGSKSTGIAQSLSGLKSSVNLKGKHIIIVEDIVESGITVKAVIEELQKLEPADIKIATCFTKLGKLKVPLKIDYLAMEVLDRFIIGYGLDWDEWGRGLEALYYIES